MREAEAEAESAGDGSGRAGGWERVVAVVVVVVGTGTDWGDGRCIDRQTHVAAPQTGVRCPTDEHVESKLVEREKEEVVLLTV